MKTGAWFERHVQTWLGAVGRMAQRPVATFMIIAVIGIALGLPLLLQVLIQNVRGLSQDWAQGVELSVYLDTSVDEAGARVIAAQLRARGDVASVQLITAGQALKDFRANSGFGTSLDLLNGNPLPDVLVVQPTVMASGPEPLDALKGQLAAIKGVDQVQLDTAWVKRLQSMLNLLHRLVVVVSTVLIAGIVLIVGTVIRLDVANRRGEIEVMKLVGGSDGFARRPFLYAGWLYGLGGGLLALLLVSVARRLLSTPVRELTATYGSGASLKGMDFGLALAVVAGASLLGWVGAWAAATWHIRRIDPT